MGIQVEMGTAKERFVDWGRATDRRTDGGEGSPSAGVVEGEESESLS